MNKKIIIIALLLLGAAGLWWFKGSLFSQEGFLDFDDDRDTAQVVDIFKEDWSLMLGKGLRESYSIEFTLKHRTSSQADRRNDLILKVWREKNDIVAFAAYHKKSLYTWRILFFMTNKKYRRQGRAMKFLKYIVDDMVERGAVRINLATQSRNVPAQSLYTKFGFKKTKEWDNHHYYSWYKNRS